MKNKKCDSTINTKKHINRVNELLVKVSKELLKRGENHDKSKLENPEKLGFDKHIPELKKFSYGSDGYFKCLEDLEDVLKHHYKNNKHHAEHHKNGINDMDIFDIVEMLFDWKAASERHINGDIYKSIKHNKKRFNMSSQLVKIFENTMHNMRYKK